MSVVVIPDICEIGYVAMTRWQWENNDDDQQGTAR